MCLNGLWREGGHRRDINEKERTATFLVFVIFCPVAALFEDMLRSFAVLGVETNPRLQLKMTGFPFNSSN